MKKSQKDILGIPEKCKLNAIYTGDGWCLEVADFEGFTIAYLDWPENWPTTINSKQLEDFGFNIL